MPNWGLQGCQSSASNEQNIITFGWFGLRKVFFLNWGDYKTTGKKWNFCSSEITDVEIFYSHDRALDVVFLLLKILPHSYTGREKNYKQGSAVTSKSAKMSLYQFYFPTNVSSHPVWKISFPLTGKLCFGLGKWNTTLEQYEILQGET